MIKYKEFPFSGNFKVFLQNSDELMKILLVLDVYDITWLQGERPMEYITDVSSPKYLVVNNKKLCLRQSSNHPLKTFHTLITEL